jgi:hypothetical protein
MLTLALATMLNAAPVAPQPAPFAVKQAMHEYYQGEFRGGFGWTSTGGLSVVAAVPMFLSSSPFLKGLAWPTGLLGLAQLGLGIASFFTAPARIKRFDAQLDAGARADFLASEAPRIKGITRAFDWFQMAELVIVAGGTGLMGAGYARADEVMVGVGLGLIIQSLMFLTLDELASRRADVYVQAL